MSLENRITALAQAVGADVKALQSSGGSTAAVANIAALIDIVPAALATVTVAGYNTAGDNGGGVFVWDAGKPATAHNGGTIIDPSVSFPASWGNDAQMITWFTPKVSGTGCWVRQNNQLGVFDVQQFGGNPDGTTDNYYVIQATIAAVTAYGSGATFKFGGGGTYYVDKYKITTPDNGIRDFNFTDIPDLIIDGCGSTLQLKGGWTRTADATFEEWTFSYSDTVILHIERCNNFVLRDLHMDGGAATITKQATAEGYCHNIVAAGCAKGLISNVQSTHSIADGLILAQSGSAPFIANTYITVINSTFTRNARQGCSVTQARWVNFIGCEFSYTGLTGTYGGHSPEGGVDVEPDFSGAGGAGNESTGDITFTGCTFKDNVGFEYVGTSRAVTPHPVQFFGCSFVNSLGAAAASPHVLSASMNTMFSGCNFDDTGLLPGYTFDDDNATVVRDSVFRWSLPTQMLSLVSANTRFTADNCKFYFTSPIVRTATLMFVSAAHAAFRNNYVYLAGSAVDKTDTYDFPFQLESMRLSNNVWDSDLNSGTTTAVVSVANSVVDNDRYPNEAYFSTWIGGYPYGKIYTAGTTKFDVLESALGTTYREGDAAPTTGTWKVGDKVLNNTPADQGFIGWACVTDGTPGTWIPFGAVSSTLPGGSTAVATPTADGLMSAADKTKINGVATSANNYVHPTTDGNKHVPATGTTNSGKVLTAGATAGSISWQSVAGGGSDVNFTAAYEAMLNNAVQHFVGRVEFTTTELAMLNNAVQHFVGRVDFDDTYLAMLNNAVQQVGTKVLSTYDFDIYYEGLVTNAVQQVGTKVLSTNDFDAYYVGQLDTLIANAGGGDPAAPYQKDILFDSLGYVVPPANDKSLRTYAKDVGGLTLLGTLGANGVDMAMQQALAFGTTVFWAAVGSSTTVTQIGLAATGTGTATTNAVALTNIYTATKRLEYAVTTASATAVCGLRSSAAQYALGNPANRYGGFHFVTTFGLGRGIASGYSRRLFAGMTSITAAPTDVQPSTWAANAIGVGADLADTNWQIMHKAGTGTMTKIYTGFDKNSADASEMFNLSIFAAPDGGQRATVRLTKLSDGTFFEHTITTNLPALTQLLTWQIRASVGGVSSVIGVAVSSVYIKTQ